MRQRRIAWAAAIAVVVVVGVVPVALDRDSFPLSTYPMFSYRRTSTEVVDTAVATEPGGRTWRLSPVQIAATDEVITAAATVSDAIAAGRTDDLCAQIAARVADDGPDDATAIEVVSERYDAIEWFEGNHTPLERDVHARCEVHR